MSGNMCDRGSHWQSEWERDDTSDTSSHFSERSGSSGSASTDASQRLRRLFNERLYTDVKFVVSCGIKPKPEVLAHKAILAVGSAEFATMFFGSSLQDRGGTTVTEYEIKNMSYESFRNVVEYLYTDDVFFESDSLVMETLSAAKKFQIHSLVGRCESYFESKEITDSNACSTLHLASTHKMERLKARCAQFIQENTRDVLRSPSFKTSLSTTVRTICKMPRLNLPSEQELFFGVLDWVESQPGGASSKRDKFEPFLKHIRFLAMTCEEFRDLVQRSSDIFTANEALNLVMYLSNPAKNKSNLPSWCSRGERRCFTSNRTSGAVSPRVDGYSERKMTIALKPTKKENLKTLTCLLEMKCMEGRHQIKGLRLCFGDPVTENSVINNMVIDVSVDTSGYKFRERIRIQKSKNILVRFTKPLLSYEGQTVSINARAEDIRNYCFLQFDEAGSFPEQSPFQCSLGCVPKDNRFFFISEVIYTVLAREKNRGPRGRPQYYRRGNAFQQRL